MLTLLSADHPVIGKEKVAAREEDFEKGRDAGIADSLSVCAAALEAAMEHAGVA